VNKLISVEGLLYKVGKILLDLLYINLLWIVFTVLGCFITGGAATTAMLYVMKKRANHCGYCNFETFFHGFKKYFVKATKIWLIIIASIAIVMINIIHLPYLSSLIGNNILSVVLFVVQLIILLHLIIISIYIFYIIDKKDNIIELFVMAFILAYKNIGITITSMALLFIVAYGFFCVPIIFLLGVSVYGMLVSILLNQKIPYEEY
jgi:uncharacterized membrane protein YesL